MLSYTSCFAVRLNRLWDAFAWSFPCVLKVCSAAHQHACCGGMMKISPGRCWCHHRVSGFICTSADTSTLFFLAWTSGSSVLQLGNHFLPQTVLLKTATTRSESSFDSDLYVLIFLDFSSLLIFRYVFDLCGFWLAIVSRNI